MMIAAVANHRPVCRAPDGAPLYFVPVVTLPEQPNPAAAGSRAPRSMEVGPGGSRGNVKAGVADRPRHDGLIAGGGNA